jgi:hypothetical protein
LPRLTRLDAPEVLHIMIWRGDMRILVDIDFVTQIFQQANEKPDRDAQLKIK